MEPLGDGACVLASGFSPPARNIHDHDHDHDIPTRTNLNQRVPYSMRPEVHVHRTPCGRRPNPTGLFNPVGEDGRLAY